MSYQIVQCEVLWVVDVGYTGNERPPDQWKRLGEFTTKEIASDYLIDAGFTPTSFGWKDKTGYGLALISRVLREIK